MADYLTTSQAAEASGLTRSALLTLAGRARRAGRELHAPREVWPDGRTPMWNGAAVAAEVAARPGRGSNLRRDRSEPNGDPGA